MSTSGFRSAELGAPAFTYSSSCKPGCGPAAGHVCSMRGLDLGTFVAVPTRCPHCDNVIEGQNVIFIPAGGLTLTAGEPLPQQKMWATSAAAPALTHTPIGRRSNGGDGT